MTQLSIPLHHSIPSRRVARTRKRPGTTDPAVARVTKKLKAFVTNDKGAVFSTVFYNDQPKRNTAYPTNSDENTTSSEQRIHGTILTCILDTGSDVNLLGRKHLKEFAKARIPYTVKAAEKPLRMQGAFGSSSATTKEIVTLSTLRLQTSEGPVEFKNIRLYLHDEADEMILGLPFTDEVGFNVSTHLAKNHEALNGFDFNQHNEIKTVHFNLRDEVLQTQQVRRVQAATWAGDYVPIQMDPRAPLDDADPLEEEAPCLTIGQLDPIEEEALISAMQDRANDAIRSYRADSYYRAQIPSNAEAQVEYLLKEYRSVFSSKLTGRPPCKIDPIRIPLKEGVTPIQSKARRYPPQKQTFLSDTCAGLEGENLVRPVRSAEWVAAPLLVPKAPPAMFRMTVDLRPINNATVKDDRPMPNMDTMLLVSYFLS